MLKIETSHNCIHWNICHIYSNLNLDKCGHFKNKSKLIELSCPIGTNLYRIDSRIIPCHRNQRERDEYSCQNYLHCYLDKECDLGKEYYIFEMENADVMTILGNQKYFGTRVFTSREEAEKKMEELKW